MTRKTGIWCLLAVVIVLLAMDVVTSPPDPYAAPDPLVWGSSEGGSGALCSLPGQ